MKKTALGSHYSYVGQGGFLIMWPQRSVMW
jgi:hypothetical protein